MAPSSGRLNAWARFLRALGGLGPRLVWTLVGLLVLGALGHFLLSRPEPRRPPARRDRTVQVRAPIPWDEVDADVRRALRESRQAAERYATVQVNAFVRGLEQRVDEDFLTWYFGYWQQQWLGLKAAGYWVAEKGGRLDAVERVFGEQASMAERITEDIQEEFAKRVLRPQVAQMQMDRIAHEMVRVYLEHLQACLEPIPEKYRIPEADWGRYLEDIAVLTVAVEGGRQVPITLKAVTVPVLVGGATAAVQTARALRPMIRRVGARVSTAAAQRVAGQTAANVAARTGARVGARRGGRLVGVLIALGIITWDVWDHHHTWQVQKPLLRQNLFQYLAEMKHSLLYEPESGLFSIIDHMEATMHSSLKRRRDKS